MKSAKNNGKNEIKIIQLEELNWKQIDSLDRKKPSFSFRSAL
jgi:hypothetical protein